MAICTNAVANTAVVEKEKEKVVDRCFEAEEKLAEATVLQTEMQAQLLLGQQREEELLQEMAAKDLDVQQLQALTHSLSENKAKLEKEILQAKLEVDRIKDEKYIDNLPPLVCDIDVARVEDEVIKINRSEKNVNRSIPRSPNKAMTMNESHNRSHSQRQTSLEEIRKKKRKQKTIENRSATK